MINHLQRSSRRLHPPGVYCVSITAASADMGVDGLGGHMGKLKRKEGGGSARISIGLGKEQLL